MNDIFSVAKDVSKMIGKTPVLFGYEVVDESEFGTIIFKKDGQTFKMSVEEIYQS